MESLASVLATLRAWRAVYERWHPGRCGGGVPPWSAADEARLDRLTATDPDELAASASRLDAVVADLGEIGRAVGLVGAGGGLGPVAAGRCVELATAVRASVAEASGLAGELRSAAAALESLLTELTAQARRLGEGVDGGYRSLALAYRALEEADRAHGAYRVLEEADRAQDRADWAQDGAERAPAAAERSASVAGELPGRGQWAGLDELFDRHAGVFTALRAAMDAAEWTVDSPGCADPPGRSCHPGRWLSEGARPAAAELVVNQDYAERVWQVWQPLPAPPARSEVSPGDGPMLPGTEGSRTGTDTGVRIAQLAEPPPPAVKRPPR
ncbi:MAG TPA: hypothetical protein VK735_22865 [Pseudonocardia sp.]|uniref:hypothetical protein n=1 Tax=Pseudonocardia sp. TaxID=60912 RepID=UPI002C5A1928|nr:hypothetical protein [Pseudonocardia sp.]HTF50290.1 hypothetical protein [Pseudonocardia sp.]